MKFKINLPEPKKPHNTTLSEIHPDRQPSGCVETHHSRYECETKNEIIDFKMQYRTEIEN